MTPPNNITLSKDKKLLTVSFKDDDYPLTSEFLRVYSPSAEVRGHGPGQETLQLNKKDVLISTIVPMGNYAIAIHFSDGHTTGIYSWSYLLHLGTDKEELWQDYINRVEENSYNNKNYRQVTI
ncbi:DUF971 domain-containing protein [Candidatus Pseudothioglobus singularis]|jgi:DUF971 family protein|nr:DUF971 domain-containing protein [Flavobacteriaceae bacterium]MBT5416343.1 DUF971 domain-containing protein [Cryomorphaceae bacterium]MBT6224735.1 DUF971 domain-containing protein [Cryomorphaceae bacterium]MDC0620641.1 DUF971 domain-containing protein [Candidatus Pseudothioglobus singularis]